MFILFTKKQKQKFVNGVADSVEIALSESGKRLAYSTKFNLKCKLSRMVKLDYNSKKDKAFIKRALGGKYGNK